MLNQPVSTPRQLGRYLLAAPLVLLLALGYSSAQAQVAPTPVATPKSSLQQATIYVDGKLFTGGDLNTIDPANILAINVLKGDEERKAFGSNSGSGTVLVTTKANADSPEVVAFNKRINSLVPLVPATPAQETAISAAAAYITKNYPGAKQEGVSIVPKQPNRYRAVFTEGGKRMQLLFDGNGQPVKQ
ncbi:MAG: hypothetical protein ACRYFZ_25025 [Janthinobacterium lividum]